MKLIYFLLICLFFCFNISYSSGIDLSQIADYTIKPTKVFIVKNKLYLNFGEEYIFLTTKLPKEKSYAKHNNEIIRLKLDTEKLKDKSKRIKDVVVMSEEICQKVINEIIIEFDLKHKKHFLHYSYKNDFGSYDEFYDEFITKKDKKNKKQSKSIETKQDRELSSKLFLSFMNTIKKYDIINKKFIFISRNMPRITYFYIDTENIYMAPLILPPYKKEGIKKNPIETSTDFLYSFIVKNHIVPVIKSPFTSTYRLFSLFSTSLLEFSPTNINEPFSDITIEDKNHIMDMNSFNEYLDEEIGTKEYKAKIKFLIDGESFFTDFIDSAKKATHSIFIQTHIFKTDEFSIEVSNFLKKCSETVDVRVLIDRIGAGESKSAIEDNIFTSGYKSPDSIIDFLEKDSKVAVRVHPNTWLTFDHRKIFIVDRKKAYIGGMNIANEYRYGWHDLMVSLEGPIVSIIVKNFYKAWSFAGLGGDFSVAWRSLFTKSKRNITKETDDMIDVRLLTTSASDYQIYDAQLEAIRRAKQRIFIESPYFSEKTLIEELILSKKRGVDVRIILPGVNDMMFFDKVNLKIANYLIENGIVVYLYPRMTHVKAAVYDNWVCLGSANFNRLSMFKNREINIAFYDKILVDEFVEQIFIRDFEISKKYDKAVEIPWIYYLV